MNSNDLKNLIVAKHPLPEWATFVELRNSTGYVKNVRTADVATFNTYPSKSKRIAYEIKIHRSDFMKELEQPAKRKWLEEIFHEVYFVCLPEVCKVEEIPEGWGLYYPFKNGKSLRRKKIAKYRNVKEELPYLFTLSIFRRLCENVHVERNRVRYVDGEKFTSDQLKEYIDNLLSNKRKSLDQQRKELNERICDSINTKHKLFEPFRTLNNIVNGRYAGFDGNNITSEQVVEWANKVKSSSFLDVKNKLLDTNRSINKLLENIEKLDEKGTHEENTQ